MDTKRLYVKLPIPKLFFLVALPGSISMLASSLYGLLDGIFVGQFLGETAFAALNLALPFVIINFSLADWIGVGSSVLISIDLGRKDTKAANNIFTCACLMIVFTGALIGLALYIGAPFLIHLLNATGDLAAFAVQYIRAYAICSPVTTIVFALDNYLRICGKIKSSMALNIGMSLLTILLEGTFLYYLHMGTAGAALANCAGMFVVIVIAMYPFLRGRMLLQFCKPNFTLRLIQKIIFSGFPVFLSNITGRLTAIMMNFFLMRLGGQDAISIYGVLMYLEDIIQDIFYGISDSLQPAIGYNYGAGNYERVRALKRCCFVSIGILSGLAAMVIFLFPEPVSRLFLKSSSTDLLNGCILALKLFSFTYLTKWFGFTTESCLIAVDEPIPASVLSLSGAVGFPVLLIGLLWPLGITGFWLNFSISSALVAGLAVVILIRTRTDCRTIPPSDR